ncbi:MAG: hypothetical protein DUD39_16245 [Coriobacteriaceae bacterium]|nr:MAG: hypothetical protein DUD39_16245 [Coriobacteriaceae bacterium]
MNTVTTISEAVSQDQACSELNDTLLPIGQYTFSPLAMEGIRALQREGIVFVAGIDRGRESCGSFSTARLHRAVLSVPTDSRSGFKDS